MNKTSIKLILLIILFAMQGMFFYGFADDPSYNPEYSKPALAWIVLSTSLFVTFFILFIIKTITLKRVNKKLLNFERQFKRLNDDRNMLLSKISETKDESTRQRITFMAQNLYEYNPGEALNFLSNMVENTNPIIRSNAVQALAQIAQPETIDMLFQLYSDPDHNVKAQVLKNMKELEKKIDNKEITVDSAMQHKLKYLLVEEKSKSEWVF
ncbi:MAG: HEAT repeat domain-containing protein [Endomicrobiales bacterium]|nr:HEAT repeat domain-containing protein [Endomicrobiales bacterium]